MVPCYADCAGMDRDYSPSAEVRELKERLKKTEAKLKLVVKKLGAPDPELNKDDAQWGCDEGTHEFVGEVTVDQFLDSSLPVLKL